MTLRALLIDTQVVHRPSCGVSSRGGVDPAIYLRVARTVDGLARVSMPPSEDGSVACGRRTWVAEVDDADDVDDGGICGSGLSPLLSHILPGPPFGRTGPSPCTGPSMRRGVGGGSVRVGGILCVRACSRRVVWAVWYRSEKYR